MATEADTGIQPDPAEPRPAIAHVGAAVDPYPEGRDAAVLAAVLAQAAGAEVMLVTVEPDLQLIIPGLDFKRMRHETEAMLRRTREEVAPQARTKIETDLSVPWGIDRFVRSERRDLLVVGSSRRGPQGEVSIGRRTRRLLDGLHCALAVAPRGLSDRPRPSIGRIGVGYDGGSEAQGALATAAELASRCGAELVIRGVVDDRIPALGWPGVWPGSIKESWQEFMDSEVAELRQRIETAARDLSGHITVDLQRGRPASSLLELSSEVQLIVIGSRRWGTIARLLLGGTGEALMHGARCPTLVVPRSTQAD